MPQQRDPFIWIVDGYVHDSEDLILTTPPVAALNKVILIDGVSVCNHEGNGGDIEIGLVQAGRLIPRRSNVNCAVGMWYRRMCGETILSNIRVYARFIYEADGNGDPCGNGNHCEMTVGGSFLEPFTTP